MSLRLPGSQDITNAGVMVGGAFVISWLVNQFAPQLNAVPGFKFIASIQNEGILESGLGILIVSILSRWLARMAGISS